MAKMIIILVVLGFLAQGTFAFPMTGVNFGELQRLFHLVDHRTCGCRGPSQCQIQIPNAEMVGFRCAPGSRFCCQRRGAYASPSQSFQVMKKDIPEHLLNKIPSDLDLKGIIVEEDKRDKVVIKPVTVDPVEKEVIDQPREAGNDIQDDTCRCVENGQCPADKIDYSFGKSCKYGYQRCCFNKDTDDPESVEHVVEVTNQGNIEDTSSYKIGLPVSLLHDMTTETTTSTTSTTTTTTTTTRTPVKIKAQHRSSNDNSSEKEKMEQYYRYMMNAARMRYLAEQRRRQGQSIMGRIGSAFEQIGLGVRKLIGL